MHLRDVCIESNKAWESNYYTAYHYANEDNEVKTVFCYQIPFPAEKEVIFLAKYGLSPAERMGFYKNLVQCIQRNIHVTNYLRQSGISSVLTFSKAEQYRDEENFSYIYLETEQVWPIMDKLLCGNVPAITVIDAVLRIATILRDINKENIAVTHRGFDFNEVYFSANKKILLGGFYYSECPSEDNKYPQYLPAGPANLPMSYLNHEKGSQGTDIQSLAYAAWNFFSGLPFDSQLTNAGRKVLPEFATEELADAILLGLSGKDETCNAFRRQVLNYRKAFSKSEQAEQKIPIRQQLCKEFVVQYIS